MGILVYLYAPLDCEDKSISPPPWLYGTLFAFLLLELVALIVNAIVMSVSCRTTLGFLMSLKNGADDITIYCITRKKLLMSALYLNGILFVFEFVNLVLLTYACWSPAVLEKIKDCDSFEGPLVFAKAIVVFGYVLAFFTCIVWLWCIDPLGCFTQGLFDRLNEINQKIRSITSSDEEAPNVRTASNYVNSDHMAEESRPFHRRLDLVCCCVSDRKHPSRKVALQDAANVLYILFMDLDLVSTDLLAGLLLLQKRQKRQYQSSSNPASEVGFVCYPSHNKINGCILIKIITVFIVEHWILQFQLYSLRLE